MKNRQVLSATMKECALHAEVLKEAKSELGPVQFNETTVLEFSISDRRILDQMAYRFTKLQDSMGAHLYPAILDLSEEPLPENTSFALKLQKLERLGAIDSVERWRELRETRNQLAHEYEDAPAIKAAVLNRFISDTGSLLDMWKVAEKYVETFGPYPT